MFRALTKSIRKREIRRFSCDILPSKHLHMLQFFLCLFFFSFLHLPFKVIETGITISHKICTTEKSLSYKKKGRQLLTIRSLKRKSTTLSCQKKKDDIVSLEEAIRPLSLEKKEKIYKKKNI